MGQQLLINIEGFKYKHIHFRVQRQSDVFKFLDGWELFLVGASIRNHIELSYHEVIGLVMYVMLLSCVLMVRKYSCILCIFRNVSMPS